MKKNPNSSKFSYVRTVLEEIENQITKQTETDRQKITQQRIEKLKHNADNSIEELELKTMQVTGFSYDPAEDLVMINCTGLKYPIIYFVMDGNDKMYISPNYIDNFRITRKDIIKKIKQELWKYHKRYIMTWAIISKHVSEDTINDSFDIL